MVSNFIVMASSPCIFLAPENKRSTPADAAGRPWNCRHILHTHVERSTKTYRSHKRFVFGARCTPGKSRRYTAQEFTRFNRILPCHTHIGGDITPNTWQYLIKMIEFSRFRLFRNRLFRNLVGLVMVVD